MTKQIVADALKILTAPGGRCDPYSDNIKRPEIVQEIIEISLTDLAAANPDLSSVDELVEAFDQVLGPNGTWKRTGSLKLSGGTP